MECSKLLPFMLAVAAGGSVAHAKPQRHDWSVDLHLGKGRLGITLTELTPELRSFLGAPSDTGVLVGHVEADSPAAQAGIKAGDVLVEVAGAKVESRGDVIDVLADKPAGEKVSVAVIRDKKRVTLNATLTERARDQLSFDFPEMHGDLFALGPRGELSKELEKLRAEVKELGKRLEKLEKR